MKPSPTSNQEHSGRQCSHPQSARIERCRRPRITRQAHVERLEDRALLSADPGFVFGIQPTSGGFGKTRVALDQAGDIYVTGEFEGTVDFDPSDSTHTNTAAILTAGSTSFEPYVAKYSPSGGLLWVRDLKGTSSSGGSGDSIAVFQDRVSGAQSVYVSGSFNGTVDFSGTGGGANYTSAVGGVFVEKLDASGSMQWVNVSLGGPNSGDGYGVAVDASGTPYVAGDWNNFVNSTSGSDIFAAKLDPTTGQSQWVQGFGGSGIDIAYGIAVGQDPTNGGQLTAYITGEFARTVSFGARTFTAQGTDIFIAKLAASGGQAVGAWQVVGTGNNTGHAITVDPGGNIYSDGYFAGTADFDPGAGTYNLTSLGFASGGLDSYVMKLDPAGNFLWARQMGAPGVTDNQAFKIALDGSGAVYAVGHLDGTVKFDAGHTNFTTIGGGGSLSKFDSSGNFLAAWSIPGTALSVAPYLDPITGTQSVFVGGLFAGTAVFPTGTTVTLSAGSYFSAYIMKLKQLPTIAGTLFNDLNNNGMNDEVSPLQGATVFLDQNQNGVLDPGELVTATNAFGAYSFPNLAPGTYSVEQVISSGYSQMAPMAGQPNTYVGTSNGQIGRVVTAVAGQFSAGNDFSDFTPNQVKTYSSTNVPLKIQDLMTTTSKLTINDSYTIFDVNVSLNITQPIDSDVKVTLTGPDGTSVLLFQELGGSGSNFTNTTLDDDAGTRIVLSSAPFAGSFQPMTPLYVFDGKNVHGTWSLAVSDTVKNHTMGSLKSWSLAVTGPKVAAPASRASGAPMRLAASIGPTAPGVPSAPAMGALIPQPEVSPAERQDFVIASGTIIALDDALLGDLMPIGPWKPHRATWPR